MIKNLYSQQGAVLVFTLLLLLLITLLGVNMVQQNRTQFMIAENSQSQTTNFSQAENTLQSAENYIASQRYVTWPLEPKSSCATPPCDAYNCPANAACDVYDCQTPGGVFQQLLPGDLQGGAVIPNQSLPSATGSNVEITKTVCAGGTPIVGLQYQDCSLPDTIFCAYDSGGIDKIANPTAEGSPSNNPCHTELYTITVTEIDNANNERVVKSDYAVRCDN